MAGLILEGGTFRPIFSAGVMDALLNNNIIFPYCIGVSAGISNGFSYISKQNGRNLTLLEKYRNDKRYLSLRNYFKSKSLFGIDFVFDEVPNKLLPFDWNEFNNYDGKVLVGVTNAQTGKIEYLDGKQIDHKCTMLKATCAIPFFFPAIEYNKNYYYDGGLCDPIPIKKSIADGNDKNLIILTRPASYKKKLSKKDILAAKILKHKYPNLVEPLLTRHILYNQTVEFCNKLEKEGKAIIIRPEDSQSINSFEKDINKLRDGYKAGYEAAISKMEQIKKII